MSVTLQHETFLYIRLASIAEDALFDADDAALLATPSMRLVAQEARAVVEGAVLAARGTRSAVPIEPRRSGRRAPRRGAAPRAIIRQLLVASPRARDIVGRTGIDAMTDAEIVAALERLAALGIVPDQKD